LEPEKQSQTPESQNNELAKQANEQNSNTRKSKRFKKNNNMTQEIVEALSTHQNIKPEPFIPNTPLCRDDGFCTFLADGFTVQIYGNGIASIMTSTQVPHSQYRIMCATIFSGLAQSNITFAQEIIESAFIQASQTGSFKQDLNSVQIDISPDINNILACEFFKYGK